MNLRRGHMLAAACTVPAATFALVIPNASAAPPSGFADTAVASVTLPVLAFGKDGDLYVSVGDGHCLEGCDPSNNAAQDLKNLNGKVTDTTYDDVAVS